MTIEDQTEYEERLTKLLMKVNSTLEHENLQDVVMVAAKIVALAILQSDPNNREVLRNNAVDFIDLLINNSFRVEANNIN